MDASHFKHVVVKPTLDILKIGAKDNAVNLLVGTALTESRLLYLRQLPKGPAIGVYQMEMNTHDDIWRNFLQYKKDLAAAVRAFQAPCLPDIQNLAVNLAYATAMARIHYLRVDRSLPDPNDALGMAKYWKQYYNTNYGKGTVEHALPFFEQAIRA